ncbi:MAG: DUF2089 domain-containing protein [Planctomycetaceae bacterium]|nr:DUF2089 domain-containing protein [Planctomycetaceae bacterium]
MQNISKKLPQSCPACDGLLSVKNLGYDRCGTDVNGHFALPLLACLTVEEQQFVLEFVRSSGSLKEMAQIRKLSYPSVRNLLDDVIAKIGALKTSATQNNNTHQ